MESTAILTYLDPQERDRSSRPGFIFRQLSRGRREWLFWVLQALFWISIGAVGILMSRSFHASGQNVGWMIFIRMVSGFMQTNILRLFYRRSPFQQRTGLTKWPMALGCCAALALVELLILEALGVAGISLPGAAATDNMRLLVVRIFVLTIWSTLYFAFHLLENAHAMELRTARAELAAREHELRQLQAQMNPHFLFNALNTVLACRNDPEAVREVTQGFSDYLRFLLRDTRPLEPLSRELDALERYLSIQASHFGGKLVCRIQCEKAARAVMVPPMVVQPLLEHAFQRRSQINDQALQIWVTASIEKKSLNITVSHTGDPVSTAVISSSGNGLHALEQRLGLLLGPQARVEQNSEKGWNRATIRVPLP